jgi:hypothetical protein
MLKIAVEIAFNILLWAICQAQSWAWLAICPSAPVGGGKNQARSRSPGIAPALKPEFAGNGSEGLENAKTWCIYLIKKLIKV